MRPVWAEINLSNLKHNLIQIKEATSPGAQLMAVVKGNAYGHGILDVAGTAVKNGASCLGTAILNEAVTLRENGFLLPILVFGYTPDDQLDAVVEYGLTQTIFDYDHAKALSEAALKRCTRAKVHVKIDSGMGRLGFLPGEKTLETVIRIAGLPGIYLEGMYTHLAAADTQDPTYTQLQLRRFSGFLHSVEKAGISIPVKHASNSAAFINYPEAHMDMVRPGIILYGIYPSPEVDRSKILLNPVMSVKCRVASVKEMDAGSMVSYGCTCRLKRNSTIAVLPLGYADGYSRILSNKAEVLIKGQRVPVIGRVCMDQCMVDITSVPGTKIGDEAVIMGRQGDEEITADEIGRILGTISYEVVCMFSERIPRRYIYD